MMLLEMIDDYINRLKYLIPPSEVIADMQNGMLFQDEDGFLVLGGDHQCLHVVHCYVRPGNQELFKKFIKITEETARYFGCRAILFTTVRPRAFGKLLAPHGYKPTEAVIFKKEVLP